MTHSPISIVGYTIERDDWFGGSLRGIRILRDGAPIHDTPYASREAVFSLLVEIAGNQLPIDTTIPSSPYRLLTHA